MFLQHFLSKTLRITKNRPKNAIVFLFFMTLVFNGDFFVVAAVNKLAHTEQNRENGNKHT